MNDASTLTFRSGHYTSFVQTRGSVPMFWSQVCLRSKLYKCRHLPQIPRFKFFIILFCHKCRSYNMALFPNLKSKVPKSLRNIRSFLNDQVFTENNSVLLKTITFFIRCLPIFIASFSLFLFPFFEISSSCFVFSVFISSFCS